MSKIALISTSTSSLDYLDISDANLRVLRMKILMKDEVFNDYVDITAPDFYARLKQDKTLVPSSTMPAIGELFELIEELESEGYNEVIVSTVSNELSGTYNMCLTVKNQYDGKMKIHVFDSRNAAITEGFISLRILKLINEGIGAREIISRMEKLRIRRKQYFMVDNLRLFVANGRLSGASGFVGSMLKIKPILQVNNLGKIVPFEKIRTQKKALAKMVDVVLEDLKDIDKFALTFISSDNDEGLAYVKNRMLAEYPNVEYLEAPITPVVGCHTGIGTVGLAYFDLTDY
jgi:DegV family protein with EDD domain